MSENINREIYTELANRIYDLDAEVYRVLGSSLGRTFTGNRDTTIRTLSMLMYTKPDGHLLRSELALISNMARTIKDPAEKSRLMTEYDEILKAIEQLPNMFGSTDILDAERAALNLAVRREKISENDHLVICISRTQGSAGNDIGFELADKLRINYYDVDHKYVQIEITESAIIENTVIVELIQKFHDAGFDILLDDFGSGYSSLASLNQMPFDTIKLDKSLVDYVGNENGEKLLKFIVQLVQSLGMKITAEGVEYKEQLDFLENLNCDDIQGFYFSKPLMLADFSKLTENN